jgi:3-mercaptopyruvate sulfurtransferase SseA
VADARSVGAFFGTDARKNKRAGAIPGAKRLQRVDLIEEDSQSHPTARRERVLIYTIRLPFPVRIAPRA